MKDNGKKINSIDDLVRVLKARKGEDKKVECFVRKNWKFQPNRFFELAVENPELFQKKD